MKKSKRIAVLLGILGAACVVTFGVTKYEEKKELIKNSDEIILEIPGDQVTALSWEYDTEYLAFHKEETWLYDEDEAFLVNEEKIMELLELFESFGASFIIEDVEDYAQYGLDDPELTITVQYTGEDEEAKEETFVLHVSRDPEEAEAVKEKYEDEDSSGEFVTAYARVGESKIIYRLPSYQSKKLMAASYDDLRHKEVFTGDLADINRIDISLEGVDYTITTEGEKNERIYLYGEEELEIVDFKNALNALKADSFTSENPAGKEEIGLVVHLDNENYPEVSVELYRYDGNCCLAVVDGEPVSFVERAQVVDLVEAVYAIVLKAEQAENN